MQERIGFNERTFKIVKFRTIRDQSGQSLSEDKRETGLGAFMRWTSLDELPQLWNVLKGEMSMVGPRPLPREYLPLFSPEQRQRHSVLPGITGWVQVNGRHGIAWSKKFEMDVYYVQHISFWLDVRILVKTIGVLVSFRKDISLAEKPFTGN